MGRSTAEFHSPGARDLGVAESAGAGGLSRSNLVCVRLVRLGAARACPGHDIVSPNGPTGHSLTNDFNLASNRGLILASFKQANGCKTAFLQSVEITAYSSRVSHALLDAANSTMYRYIMRDSIDQEGS